MAAQAETSSRLTKPAPPTARRDAPSIALASQTAKSAKAARHRQASKRRRAKGVAPEQPARTVPLQKRRRLIDPLPSHSTRRSMHCTVSTERTGKGKTARSAAARSSWRRICS
eukprot:3842248-Pyramimonas_sp.AAC.1